MKKTTRKIGFKVLSITVLMMAALAGPSVYAQQLQTFSTGYEFGPDAGGGSSRTVNLRVPARTTIVNVTTTIRRDPGPGAAAIHNIPLKVQFKNPQNGNAVGAQFPSAGVVQIALPDFVNPLGTFRSQKGCDNTWKVIIKTKNGRKPPARVWGTVTFIVMLPFEVNLDMDGVSPVLNHLDWANRTLSGHELAGSTPALIAGPGRFHIKAKWDTDWTDVWHPGDKKMYVGLKNPNGTIVKYQNDFARNIDFSYTATQADANMSGRWKIYVRNWSDGRTVNFDIENWPGFNSTFQGVCSGGSSIN